MESIQKEKKKIDKKKHEIYNIKFNAISVIFFILHFI